jgi:5-methylcytosine-specific restriction protein A
VTGFSKKVRDMVATRANGRCERCGLSAPAYQIHHRRPRGAGGSKAVDTNCASNGFFVCVSCHSAIEDNRADSLQFGWLVRQGQSPTDVKVLRRGTWVQLADDGWMH